MADVGVVYTLNTPGTDITFNEFTDPFVGEDQYYITEIRGLGAPSLRTPIDPVPLGDGALVHPFYFGQRTILVEGTIIVQSTTIQNSIVAIRNQMEADLSDALQDIIRSDGTFFFTPQGQGTTLYTVRYGVPVDYTHTDNYRALQFSFGLVAGDPFA